MEDTTPCDRKTISFSSVVLQNVYILFVLVVTIARHISRFVAELIRYGVGQKIINTWSFSVFIPSSLHLICRCGSAPQEIIRKFAVFEVVVCRHKRPRKGEIQQQNKRANTRHDAVSDL